MSVYADAINDKSIGNANSGRRRGAPARFLGGESALAMHRVVNDVTRQMRGEHLDEVVGVTAQITVFADADAGRARFEQMAGVDGAHVGVALRVVGHHGDDAHAHAQLNIGLDDVCVDSSKDDIGRQPLVSERLIDLGPAGKGEVIGNDREGGDGFHRQFLGLQQYMTRLDEDATIPLVAGKHDQIFIKLDGLGRDRNVGFAGSYHFRDLRGATLAQRQAHVGITLGESLNDMRKGIARLRMSGCNGEATLVLFGELLPDLLEVVGVLEYALRDIQYRPARFRYRHDTLAVAHENIDPYFVFQAANLLADAGLRGMQDVRSGRQVEVLACNFADIAQLLQFHGVFPLRYRAAKEVISI